MHSFDAAVDKAVAEAWEACIEAAEGIAVAYQEQADAEDAHGDYASAGYSTLCASVIRVVVETIRSRASGGNGGAGEEE